MTRVRICVLASLALALTAPMALATREPTAAPVYYLIDYKANHLDNPEYIEWIRELPPELLHFGKDVPMTHIYGPISAVGGENQAHGRNRDDIRRLTPDEVAERIAVLQHMNEALHDAGVEMVMPYTSAITFAGEPDTRSDDPPENWPAIKADGSLHTFGKLLQPEYYAGLYRYVACIENPAWRNWLVQVHRLVAMAGYDGAFPDNTSPINCYGPHCQQGFRAYIAEKFTAGDRMALFGAADVAKLEIPSAWPSTCTPCATVVGRSTPTSSCSRTSAARSRWLSISLAMLTTSWLRAVAGPRARAVWSSPLSATSRCAK